MKPNQILRRPFLPTYSWTRKLQDPRAYSLNHKDEYRAELNRYQWLSIRHHSLITIVLLYFLAHPLIESLGCLAESSACKTPILYYSRVNQLVASAVLFNGNIYFLRYLVIINIASALFPHSGKHDQIFREVASSQLLDYKYHVASCNTTSYTCPSPFWVSEHSFNNYLKIWLSPYFYLNNKIFNYIQLWPCWSTIQLYNKVYPMFSQNIKH